MKSNKINHHYVPQFYFKFFSRGQTRIHLLLTLEGRVILNAGIRGQCARHKFYGSSGMEEGFSNLEALQSAALRKVIDAASADDPAMLSYDQLPWLLQGIVFQRARTMLEVEKQEVDPIFIDAFKEYLRHRLDPGDHDLFIGALERGEAIITEDPTSSVLRHISIALESAVLLLDLHICVLRNQTEYPFIFSDAPVVLYNTYYRNVKHRGVLGLQSPGLQVFLPLNSKTQLMLLDAEVYSGSYQQSAFCEITSRSDVSNLNALQLHHSRKAVYFADSSAADYVRELWETHRTAVVKPKHEYRTLRHAVIDGRETSEPVYQSFEPHLNHTLDLSFVCCEPVRACDFKFRHRSPKLVELHDQQQNHFEEA